MCSEFITVLGDVACRGFDFLFHLPQPLERSSSSEENFVEAKGALC